MTSKKFNTVILYNIDVEMTMNLKLYRLKTFKLLRLNSGQLD